MQKKNVAKKTGTPTAKHAPDPLPGNEDFPPEPHADFSKPLYNLPALLERGNQDRRVFVVEGEKDCDAIGSIGLLGVSPHDGAAKDGKCKWTEEHTASLKGRRVVIIADKDDAGRRHADAVAGLIRERVESLKVIVVPDRDGYEVKDAADYIKAGASAAELVALVDETPEWVPVVTPEDVLAEKYGPAAIRNDKGEIQSLNERHLAGLYSTRHDILFEPGENRFFEYAASSGLWVRLTDDTMREKLSGLVLAWLRERQAGGKIGLLTVHKMKSMTFALRGIAERVDAFANRPTTIHAANGMVLIPDDGSPPRLEPFARTFMSRAQSPIAFDPGASCPRMVAELLDPVLSKEDQCLLQKFAGLALIGRNLPQRIALLHGEGNLGKGTYLRLLKMVIGRDNVRELRTEMLHERFEIGRYAGGSLLLGQDVPANFLMHRGSSALKKLTGGDDVDGEGKGSNELIRLAGTFNVIITSNSRLRAQLEGDHSAWRRRLALIEFMGDPPAKRITDFDEVLIREEGAGILNWCIAGFINALRDIRENGDLRLTDIQKERVENLLLESDSIRLFVETKIEEADGGTIAVEEAVKGYFDFCRNRGFAAFNVQRVETELKTLILDIHGAVRRNDLERFKKHVRGWRNVRLREDQDDSRTTRTT